MAKIRKIYDQTIKPNGVKTTIYPITSTRAVYTTDGNTLDNYLKTKNIYGTSLDGYKEVNSIDDLPDTPSEDEKKYGYIIGTKLYIYVGEGGTIKGGKYADCGTFEGASAYDIAVDNGFIGTEQEWLDSLHAPLAHVTRSDVINALSYTPVSPQELAVKVDKDGNKGLSDNNFTAEYKSKIDNVDSTVNEAVAAAESARNTMSRLEELLEEAEVDQSVIDLTKISGSLAETDVQVKTNKNQIFGATQNYIENRVITSGGTAAASSSGWNSSGWIDVSDVWLESGNQINWYYGSNENTSACLCNYSGASTNDFLSYHAAAQGGPVNREWTWEYPTTKYIRLCYLASYADAKLIVNGKVVWTPQSTVSGLVPFMESASSDMDVLKDEVLQNPTTKVAIADASASGKSMEDWVLHRWHQETAITLAAGPTSINSRFRSVQNGGSSYNRSKNRVLVESCVPGDRFILSGPNQNYTNSYLWGFFDGIDWTKPISTAKDQTAYTNQMVVAPEGAAYIVINWYHNNEEPVTTEKFFKVSKDGLRDMVLSLQESVGSYGKGDILTFNPEKDVKPKLYASRKGSNPVTIAHFSDTHASNSTQVGRFIEFCNAFSSYINVKLNTGDIVPNQYSDMGNNLANWWYRQLSGAENIFNVIGNHDVAKNSGGVYDWTNHVGDDAYNAYIEPFVENWGVSLGGENKCYYYKDFESSSLRLIMLDMPGYDSDEDSWLQTILEDALTRNYTVAIASHFVGAVIEAFPDTENRSTFTSRAHDSTGSTHYAYMKYPELYAMAAKRVDNFIENNGIFACWITGHLHYDFLSKVRSEQANDITINHTQLVVSVDTSSNVATQYEYSDIAHVTGTKLQDCFNLLTINTVDQMLYIVRVGCDLDKWMRKKDVLCMKYITGEIITQ